ncbi:hypothetical protein BpHYR1_022936, partial [Brachionus plicatilis]
FDPIPIVIKLNTELSLLSLVKIIEQDFSTEIFIFHLKSHCSNSTNKNFKQFFYKKRLEK